MVERSVLPQVWDKAHRDWAMVKIHDAHFELASCASPEVCFGTLPFGNLCLHGFCAKRCVAAHACLSSEALSSRRLNSCLAGQDFFFGTQDVLTLTMVRPLRH
jgi:hypothetical protein